MNNIGNLLWAWGRLKAEVSTNMGNLSPMLLSLHRSVRTSFISSRNFLKGIKYIMSLGSLFQFSVWTQQTVSIASELENEVEQHLPLNSQLLKDKFQGKANIKHTITFILFLTSWCSFSSLFYSNIYMTYWLKCILTT